MIEAIIFDFYGVLYSNFDWGAIDARIYSDPEKTIIFREAMQQANLGEISNREFLQRSSELAQDSKYPGERAVNLESSINYSALGLIERLKETYKIGLLSNGSHIHIKDALDDAGGEDKYFDVVITSSDSRNIKPAASAFFDIVQQLDTKPQSALLVDDSPGHIAGATAAGLRTIRFSDMENLRIQLRSNGIERA